MNGKQGTLLVAGDYGASDEESDNEYAPPLKEKDSNTGSNTLNHPNTYNSQHISKYEKQGKR